MNYTRNSIGWCDWTWNSIKGLCKGGCSYCYARKIYQRFKLDPTIRFDLKELNAPKKLKKPSKIFVCSTHDIFGDWLKREWVEWIFNMIQQCPQHTFQVLTKYPQNIGKFILNRTMPDNVWLGITITGKELISKQKRMLVDSVVLTKAKINFISFEPLLGEILFDDIWDYLYRIDWIILGGQSGSKKFFPPEKWIQKIENEAREKNIPIFEKDNLRKKWDKPPIRNFPV